MMHGQQTGLGHRDQRPVGAIVPGPRIAGNFLSDTAPGTLSKPLLQLFSGNLLLRESRCYGFYPVLRSVAKLESKPVVSSYNCNVISTSCLSRQKSGVETVHLGNSLAKILLMQQRVIVAAFLKYYIVAFQMFM